MPDIPIEDEFTDIVHKTQRGLGLSNADLARTAGVTEDKLSAVKNGEIDEAAIRDIAGALKLGAGALAECANRSWRPAPQSIEGLALFNTVYHDMTVNAYVVHDPVSKAAVVFDTGADAHDMIEYLKSEGLSVKAILLTHTHRDHIADLDRLKSATNAPVFVHRNELIPGAEGFDEGREFEAGALRIETRLTSGHAAGGVTFVIRGLAKPVAIVGDAIFAGSMGGGLISFDEALENNRRKIMTLPDETVLCPGHGPLTTVGEEKKHNAFFPEFQQA